MGISLSCTENKKWGSQYEDPKGCYTKLVLYLCPCKLQPLISFSTMEAFLQIMVNIYYGVSRKI